MPIYAISDLHLSLACPKPMDIFGEQWEDHARRIAANWDAAVQPSDTVLVAGDHSWAMRFDEAVPDIEFIAARPGRKLLVRGNHDYWWRREATNRLQTRLPESITLLHGRGIVVENCGIAGTRGWRIEDGPDGCDPGDARVHSRELGHLERGLAELPADVAKKIAVLHYPPFDQNLAPNDFDAVLRSHGVSLVVYGHIHSGLYLEGRVNGVDYVLASVDHTDFAPVRVV